MYISMKMKIILIILVLVAVLFAINSCTTEQTTNGEKGKTIVDEPGKGVIKPTDPNKEGLATVADLPLAKIITPLSVKDVIEHRSALKGKTITVKGYIVEAILGEEACPTNTGNSQLETPGGCAQPRIIIADTLDKTRDIKYDLIILVGEDEKSYTKNQLVEVKAIVDASKVAVVLNKVY